MGENIFFLGLTLIFCIENGIFFTQAAQLNRVELRYESNDQNIISSAENAIPVDLINLQMTFKTIQNSLRTLQITLETIKTKQSLLHRSLLNTTRLLKTPSYDLWKIMRDEKLFLTDIKDVQRDITKMKKFISYWETELEVLELEEVITHEKFSRRVMEVIQEVEEAALDIMKKLKEGQQLLKDDIAKMKYHVELLKTEINSLMESMNVSQKVTQKRETSKKTETIADKGESVIELGKKLQQLKSTVEHVKSDVKITLYLTKMKHNLGNIAQNLSKMIEEIGDLNLEQLKIELESEVESGKGVLSLKIGKLYKEVDHSVGIAVSIGKKFAAVQSAKENRVELLDEVANKLLFLSKNIFEFEDKLEVIANAILENGQLLVRQGKFTEGVRERFHVQGGIVKDLAGNLENIGENFEAIGKIMSELGERMAENGEQKLGNVGALLIGYAIK